MPASWKLTQNCQAFTQAGVKRKYDLCLTAANVDHSPDGMPVAAWLQSGWGVYCFINLFFGILEVWQALFVQTAGLFTFKCSYRGGSFVYHYLQVGSSFADWTELRRQGRNPFLVLNLRQCMRQWRVYEESICDLPLITSSFTATLSGNFRLCSL